jgi:molybdenum cofactor guanylyltransferase
MKQQNITGIILAGGQSSRMGTDKSLVEFKGKPLIQYAIDAIKPLCGKVIISVNHNRYDFTGCESWPDIIEGNAPMVGIYSCLVRSTTELNIIHTCDMPLVSTALFDYLLADAIHFDITVPRHHFSYIEPLCGIYSRLLTGEMESCIHSGNFRLHEFILATNHQLVDIHSSMELFRESMFSNINSMEDLKRLSSLS